jgi:N-acetylglucosamine-6-phosphate deacetylase
VDEGGLCGVTHLFNAMSQLGPREAGVVGVVFERPELWAGIILDGHHVSVPTARIAWRQRGRERMVLVSDAMAVAGTDLREFMLQGVRIQVRNGRCEDEAGTLAGAAICLADAVRIGVQRYSLSVEDALYSATTAPARAMGLDGEIGRLRVGARADLVLWDQALAVAGVLQRGAWVLPPDGPWPTGSNASFTR